MFSLIWNLSLLCDLRALWNLTLEYYYRSLIWESGLKVIWPTSIRTGVTQVNKDSAGIKQNDATMAKNQKIV